jgi:hypothetical protein
MRTCDKHGHEFTADRYGFMGCWECDYEERNRCTAHDCTRQGFARYPYRVYAGRYCDQCWAERRQGYRDHGDNDRPDSDLDEPIDAD